MAQTESKLKTDQRNVIAFLKQPSAYPALPGKVDVIETHGALIFLAGDEVLKIKRAVKFDYLDFSTLAKREAICRRELALNKPSAPQLYLDVVAITQDPNGELAINGPGEPVEWAVHMRRFDQEALYSALAERNKISRGEINELAGAIAHYHKRLDPAPVTDGAGRIGAILQELRVEFAGLGAHIDPNAADAFLSAAEARLDQVTPTLNARASAGLVRRCHGDLHLGNIVQLDGKPVLFDALEFDETLATTDLLYEMAFLVMDLWHKGLRAEANLLLNRYLFETADLEQLDGLGAFGLFMAIRAAIRAMVSAQRAAQMNDTTRGDIAEAQQYLRDAIGLLAPSEARLVAVGGLSGTGKSTLAAEIAVHIGAVPGAIHIRSDLERKLLFGAGETERLDDACYTPTASIKVYTAVITKAAQVLSAGHSVIADAVFADQTWRQSIEGMAREIDVPFTGLWLTAPEEDLLQRVEARRGDASDATFDTVRQQLAEPAETVSWAEVDAGGSALETLIAAELILRQADALRFDEDFAEAKAAS